MSLFARFVLAITLSFIASAGHAQQVGDRIELPDVMLEGGQRLTAASMRGKPLMVVFWASWCPYCANHLPHVEKLQKKVRGTDLQIVAVSVDSEPANAKEYMARKGYTFAYTTDKTGLEKVFGARRILPRTVVIDRQGRIAFATHGEMLEDDVLELIKYAGKK